MPAQEEAITGIQTTFQKTNATWSDYGTLTYVEASALAQTLVYVSCVDTKFKNEARSSIWRTSSSSWPTRDGLGGGDRMSLRSLLELN